MLVEACQHPLVNRRLVSLALPSHAIDQVKQENSDQGEKQDEQEGIDIPKIRHHHVANLGNCRDGRKNVLIGETENYCTNQETQKTGDDIVELAFAATGGASTRSVTGERHAYPKY